MILVAGTMRSGTSLWMQVLQKAGFPVVGEEFPGVWGESLREANPRGFFESRFRKGIYFATNPDPKTGVFLTPRATQRHVTKVFIPGLIRTDVAYLDRVIVTVRHWREYDSSVRRLRALEDRWLLAQREKRAENAPVKQATGKPLPPAIDWWLQCYEVIRDIAVRRYPVNVVTYDQMLRAPTVQLERILPWLGGGDLAAAVAAVEPSVRTQHRQIEAVDGVDAAMAAVFDAFYDELDRTNNLSSGLIAEMDVLQRQIEERFSPAPQRQQFTAGAAADVDDDAG